MLPPVDPADHDQRAWVREWLAAWARLYLPLGNRDLTAYARLVERLEDDSSD